MKDRVRPPQKLENILNQLKEENVFETKQKGFMFAAAVGFALHRDEVQAVEIDGYGEAIKLEYFRKPQDEGFIDAMAVTQEENLSVLDNNHQEDRIELFEKYAMLGLQDMKRCCYDDRPKDPLLGILALIDEMEDSGLEVLPGLDETSKQLGEFF